jgi:DNA-directed RNA polymerase specialized sigma24 family protein
MDEADWDTLESRARTLLAEQDRWPAWWAAAAPAVERWVSAPTFSGRIATDEDHRREVVVLTWEKLQERDYAKLRTFFARPGDEASTGTGRRFRAWLRRVVKNIGIDYLRSLPEFVRKRPAAPSPQQPAASAPSHDYWLSIVSITSNVAVFRDPLDGRAEAQRLLDFLDQEVPARRRLAVEMARAGRTGEEVAQALGLRDVREAARVVARAEDRLKFRPALELWSHGYADEEIAARLGLADGAAAERMIKAAKELLRRSFRSC